MLDKLVRAYRPIIARDIANASAHMVRVWRETRDVPPPEGLLDALTQTYQRLATASVAAFAGRVYAQGKARGHKLERKEDFAALMLRYALQYIASEAVRRRITNVTETTRAQIIRVIEIGYAEGDTIDTIADALIELIPELSYTRAEMIARTETHGAANFGAQKAAEATGLPLSKEWNSAEDERTRESHVEASGQIVGMSEKFDVGGALLDYPGDPSGPPEETINCRCAVSHIVRENAEPTP